MECPDCLATVPVRPTVESLRAQLADRDAQIAMLETLLHNNQVRRGEVEERHGNLLRRNKAMRGVVEAAQNHVNAPSCRRPHMSFGHETCMPSGDPCDLHTYHMLRHEVSQLRALNQAQQQEQPEC